MSANQSRLNENKTKPSSQRKPKNKSCCLWCFGRSISDSSINETYLNQNGEATDLLVEKMVVQRVPLRMFATEEDYRKMEAERSERQLQPSIRPFEKYYSTLPKTDIKTASKTKVRPLERSAISLRDVQVEVHEDKFPFAEAAVGTRCESDERQRLATNVLNHLSSLQTFDSKGVPKDPYPLNPPRKPPDALADMSSYYWRHQRNPREHVRSATLQVGGRDIGRELTPEMKDTLLMLGSAKKPGNYKFQKQLMKNQTRKKKLTSDSVAIQSSGTSYQDFVVLPKPAYPTYPPDNYLQHFVDAYTDNTMFPIVNCGLFRNRKTIADAKQKLSGEKQEHVIEPSGAMSQQRMKSTVNFADDVMRRHSIEDEEPTGTQQITEIKQIKGSSLKWRIIIRHRNEPKNDE